MGFLFPKAPKLPTPAEVSSATTLAPPPTAAQIPAPSAAPGSLMPRKAPSPTLGGTYLTGAAPLGQARTSPAKRLFGG